MGLFSSKKKTKVGTSVSRIIEDKRLPNAIRQGILTSTFQQRPVAYSIQKALLESAGFNTERMYDYAKRNYTYGLPSGSYTYASQGTDQVRAILTAQEKAPVSLIYSRLGAYNYFHHLNSVGLHTIFSMQEGGVFTVTQNFFNTTRTVTAYYTGLTIVIPESQKDDFDITSVVEWGAPIHYTKGAVRFTKNNYVVSSEVTVPTLRVNFYTITPAQGYSFTDNYVPAQQVHSYHSYPLPNIPDEGDFFQACYKLANGTTKYWTYRLGDGKYPQLDSLHNALPTTGGTFFPFAYFRYGKASMMTQKNTPAYDTSRKMLKKLGLDLEEITEAIHENPDIKDIEQAMFYMGVPGVTKDPLEARYLFDFFNQVHMAKGNAVGVTPPTTSGLWASQLLQAAEEAIDPNLQIHNGAFSIADKRFKMSLNNQGIHKRLVVGSIGKIGSYDCTTSTYKNAPRGVITAVEGTPHYDAIGHQGASVRYRHQLSSRVYEEIQVINPGLTYHIYGNHTKTGNLSHEEIFLVPIDKSITKHYSLKDREILYTRSMHFVFNSRITTRVKWYQQGWFSTIIQIVGIAISIISMQPGFAAMAATASAGTAAIITLIAKGILQVLIRFAIATAAKYVLKEVAPQLLTIVAVVAAVVAIVGGMPAGLSNTPWAEHLLSASNVLMSTGQSNLQNLMSGLKTEAESFLADAEQKMKLLEDTQDLLYNDPILLPLVVFGESPQDFYNRTVHSGNVGTLSIKSVSTYVRRSLTLPTVQQTLGAQYA